MTGDFQSSSIRTARKQHTCGECREPIQPGEKYKLWSGKGDGGMYSNKMCSVCDAANDVAWNYVRANQFMDDDDGPCFGELLDWLSEAPPEPLPPYPDPQPDTKTLDMFPGLPPVKRVRTKREQIAAYSAMLKQYLDQNFRLVGLALGEEITRHDADGGKLMTPRQWALDMADILSQTIDAEPDHLRRIDLAIRIIARTNRRFADVFDLSAEEAASAIWDGYEVSK